MQLTNGIGYRGSLAATCGFGRNEKHSVGRVRCKVENTRVKEKRMRMSSGGGAECVGVDLFEVRHGPAFVKLM
nr:hypothetical protein [Tanacetum cinerariifolium]